MCDLSGQCVHAIVVSKQYVLCAPQFLPYGLICVSRSNKMNDFVLAMQKTRAKVFKKRINCFIMSDFCAIF